MEPITYYVKGKSTKKELKKFDKYWKKVVTPLLKKTLKKKFEEIDGYLFNMNEYDECIDKSFKDKIPSPYTGFCIKPDEFAKGVPNEYICFNETLFSFSPSSIRIVDFKSLKKALSYISKKKYAIVDSEGNKYKLKELKKLYKDAKVFSNEFYKM